MKVYRGDHWKKKLYRLTDSKKPNEYIKGWDYQEHILRVWLSGTINKQGKRHTGLLLKLDESDIVAMSTSLVRRLRNSSKRAAEDGEKLRTALQKISDLISLHKDKFHNTDDLLRAVERIADYYRWSLNRSGHPEIEQIKWKDI